jgi:hypothetical protein
MKRPAAKDIREWILFAVGVALIVAEVTKPQPDPVVLAFLGVMAGIPAFRAFGNERSKKNGDSDS